MDTLTGLDRALIYVFLISSMMSVGMQTTTAEFRELLVSRSFLLRLLIVNFIVVPLTGIVLIKSLRLTPETSMALLLLACTPGGVSALQFTTKIKGAAVFAGSSAVLLTLLAVLVTPVILFAAQPEIPFIVPYGRVLLFVALLLLAPLGAGMWVKAKWKERAGTLLKLLLISGSTAFVALVLLLAGARGQAAAAVGKAGVLAIFVLIFFSMAAGWLMGGGASGSRPILAIVTSMRNAALCLLIAERTFSSHAVQEPLVAFSALMLLPNLLLTAYVLIRSRRAEKRGGHAKGK